MASVPGADKGRVTDERLVDLALGAVGHRATPAEEEAAHRPPYPTPVALVPFQERVALELQARLDRGGPNPIVSTRMYGLGEGFDEAGRLALIRSSGFDVNDAVCLLLGGGILEVADAHAIQNSAMAPDSRRSQFLQVAIVNRCIADGDLVRAAFKAQDPRVAGDEWVAWRDIARHHADSGHQKAFSSHWKQYRAADQKNWMKLLKQLLVVRVARRHGWAEAKAETDHPRLAEVLERVVVIEPQVSKGVMGERDLLLWWLGLSAGEAATLKSLRSALRTPWMRSDVKTLGRETA